MFEEFFSVIKPDEDWVEDAALTFIETVHVFTLPLEDTLDELGSHVDKIGKDAYAKVHHEIGEIGDEIKARNQESKKAGKAVYSYLHPSVTPASIGF